MEEKYFVNKTGDQIYYLKWEAADPKCALVISHGMAEHPERYDDVAPFLSGKAKLRSPGRDSFAPCRINKICASCSLFNGIAL